MTFYILYFSQETVFSHRGDIQGLAQLIKTALPACIFLPWLCFCSFMRRRPRQNWSDISKLHGDETISQCSDFNSTPWGNIVSSHYSSSRGRHNHSVELLSSVARVFSCAPETMADVMYKLQRSCHVATKGHSAMIKTLKWRLHRNFVIISGGRCIARHSLDEMIICWNGVAYKLFINHSDTVILPAVYVEYSQLQCDWHSTNDPCLFPIHLCSSLCVQNATNYSPGGFTLL